MESAKDNKKNKSSKCGIKSRKVAMSSVISVRIPDDEKARINEIMKSMNIKRNSDFMRVVLQMVQQQLLSG